MAQNRMLNKWKLGLITANVVVVVVVFHAISPFSLSSRELEDKENNHV
jgi:hypothetical protein